MEATFIRELLLVSLVCLCGANLPPIPTDDQFSCITSTISSRALEFLFACGGVQLDMVNIASNFFCGSAFCNSGNCRTAVAAVAIGCGYPAQAVCVCEDCDEPTDGSDIGDSDNGDEPTEGDDIGDGGDNGDEPTDGGDSGDSGDGDDSDDGGDSGDGGVDFGDGGDNSDGSDNSDGGDSGDVEGISDRDGANASISVCTTLITTTCAFVILFFM